MGLERTIKISAAPSWPAWTSLLAARGLTVQARMIDGELAFPDEIPAEGWKELRVGLPAGMITLRNEPGALRIVTWGNASPELLAAWNAVVWALAKAGEGRIATEQGERTAEEFAKDVGT